VRVVSATNVDLHAAVEEGTFREDLYYRLNVVNLEVPPLRQRRSDIPLLVAHFVREQNERFGTHVQGFTPEAMDAANHFEWPGNVRQLRNVVERAVILCERETIGLKDLPLLSEISDIENLFDNTPTTNEALKAVKAQIRQKAIARVESNFLTHALAGNDWNVTRAAKAVGMQRPNFQNMMKKHGITLPTNH